MGWGSRLTGSSVQGLTRLKSLAGLSLENSGKYLLSGSLRLLAGCGTMSVALKFLYPSWQVTRGHYQLLEVTSIPCPLTPCISQSPGYVEISLCFSWPLSLFIPLLLLKAHAFKGSCPLSFSILHLL